jgi:hypothetical protein
MLTPLEIDNLLNLLENVAGELIAHLLETLGRRAGRLRGDRTRGREAEAISGRVARAALDAGLREHPEFTSGTGIPRWPGCARRSGRRGPRASSRSPPPASRPTVSGPCWRRAAPG